MLTEQEILEKSLSFRKSHDPQFCTGFQHGAKWANEHNTFDYKTQRASADIALSLLTNEIQSSERSEKTWQRKYDDVLRLALEFQEEKRELADKVKSLSGELDTERLKYSLAVSMAKSLQKDALPKHGGGTVEWFVVADRLPPTNSEHGDSAHLLCVDRTGEMYVGWYNSKTLTWDISHWLATSKPAEAPTHWAFLPAPPVKLNLQTY